MQKMEENNSQGIPPVVERGERWRSRQQQQGQQNASSSTDDERKEECLDATSHRPAPLPFGKIDVVA